MERFIDVEEVIATASTLIPGMSDEEKLISKQWAWMAMRKIGPSSDNIETKDVDVIDKTIEIPNDSISIIDMALYDVNGNEIKYRFHSGGSMRTHLKNDVSSTRVNIYQDHKFIHISDNGYEISNCRLKYYAMPLSDCNEPLIPEAHLFPVVMFIRWMMTIRNKPASSFEIVDAERSWRQALDVAKVNNKSVSMILGKEIARTWSSMIPNPNFNRY